MSSESDINGRTPTQSTETCPRQIEQTEPYFHTETSHNATERILRSDDHLEMKTDAIQSGTRRSDVIFSENIYYFLCPHCNTMICVEKKDLNCKIFRCGVFKHNNQPINPHLSKIECDKLKIKGTIYGCGRPFKFYDTYVEECPYI